MEHYFDLHVVYNGVEQSYKGRLVTFGYIYKFYIVVEGVELVFEKDEEPQYRVLSENEDEGKTVDAGLLQAIVRALEHLSV